MPDNPGVFICAPQNKLDVVIEGCQTLMKKIEGNNYSIAGVKSDTVYGGFRVYFNDYSIVAYFLKQKYLPTNGCPVSIHSLNTILAVCDVIPPSENSFKEELQAQLEKLQLKPVLQICPKPISPKFPDIPSCGDWLINLEIPEIEDMELFRNVGLPDDMTLTFSCGTDSSLLEKKVSHLCGICYDCSHSRERCPGLENIFSSSSKKSDDLSPKSNDSFYFPSFEIRKRVPGSVAAPSTSKSAKQHRIEAIASNLEKIKQKNMSAEKVSLTEKQIKQEPVQDESSHSIPSKRSLSTDAGDVPSKKKKSSLHAENPIERYFKHDDTATSTTGRESPVIIYEKLTRTSRNSSTDREGLNEDNSIPTSSPNLPTSSQPETSFEPACQAAISHRDSSYFSDSNDSVKSPKPRKKPIYAPVVLPPRIKEIVLNRGRKEGELDAGQLEAFFNHVKKKMSPAKIARQFTSDVHCLKEQLMAIVQQYYMTPKAGSGEDSRFMKWLEGMLERFDSVPGKRKKFKSEPMH